MSYGFTGNIGRVNLTSGEVSIEHPPEEFYRRYIGGRGIIAYYLLRELPRACDPLGAENKIVFATSPVTGAPVPGASRNSVGAKSPLTGGYGEAEAGGHWGPELKFAGFDALIIEGKATAPVYIWVNDGAIQMRNAAHLWGKETGEAKELLKRELNDNRICVASIGPAGENLVKMANIMHDLHHAAGRSGLGAVMGSKNLKAVVVRGTRQISIKDTSTLKERAQFFAKNYMTNDSCRDLHNYGSASLVNPLNLMGLLPTLNFQYGTFEHADKVNAESLHKELVRKSDGCYACPVRCKRIASAEKPYTIDARYGGPEYEAIAAFSSNCGVSDIAAVVKANELCNRYGLDSIGVGSAIAFAMECFEKGILTHQDTGGITLEFGNAQAMLQLVQLIAFRRGLGNVLADGVLSASRVIGKGSERYAMQTKGQSFPMHEPRGKAGVGLGYVVSPTGADHLQIEHDSGYEPLPNGQLSYPSQQILPLGILNPMEATSIDERKVRLFMYLQNLWSLANCMDYCIYTFAPCRLFTVNDLVTILNAVTGWQTSLWELMKVGERATTLARCFNVKHGLLDEGTLPSRFFEALPDGLYRGSRIDPAALEAAKRLYYEMMGWEPENGIPKRARLAELDILWADAEL